MAKSKITFGITKNIKRSDLRQKERRGEPMVPYPMKWLRTHKSRGYRVAHIVQRARDHFGKPAIVVSGYRTLAYNRKVGGARNSRHMRGEAIDVKIKGVSAHRVHDWILAEYRAGHMPELGGLGRYPSFTHVDVRSRKRLGRLARWRGSRK